MDDVNQDEPYPVSSFCESSLSESFLLDFGRFDESSRFRKRCNTDVWEAVPDSNKSTLRDGNRSANLVATSIPDGPPPTTI